MVSRLPKMLIAAAVIAAAACTTQSSPLTPTGRALRLTGTVKSMAGGQIAGARLTVQNGANKGAQVASDSGGRYAFGSLQSDRFTLLIEAPGFVSAFPIVDLLKDIDVDFALRRIE